MKYLGWPLGVGLVILMHLQAVSSWKDDHPLLYWWGFYEQTTWQEKVLYHLPILGSAIGFGLVGWFIVWRVMKKGQSFSGSTRPPLLMAIKCQLERWVVSIK